jgi:hypothetical protein
VSKFAFVAAERANHAVVTLCRIAGASVSGFYAWLRAIPAVQNRVEAEARPSGFPCMGGRLTISRPWPW